MNKLANNAYEPIWLGGQTNLNCLEYYRLHGTLTPERIEWLIQKVIDLSNEIDGLENGYED